MWRNSATERRDRSDGFSERSTFPGYGYSDPPHEEKEEITYTWFEPKQNDPGANYKPGKFKHLDEAIKNLKNGKR